jgi:hypothetical protein
MAAPTGTVSNPKGLTEAQYHAVLNFFYFLLLDEGLALNAAYKSVKIMQNRMTDLRSQEKADAILISVISEVFHKYKKRHATLHSVVQPPKSDWKTPSRESVGAWKEYMRRSTDEAPETMVLHYILNFPVAVISEGLNIPEGTVYFRLGRGLEGFAQGSHLVAAVKK